MTHTHGDHCFGIGGLLQAVSAAREGTPLADAPFMAIGPPGLQGLVGAALSFGAISLCMPLVSGPSGITSSTSFPIIMMLRRGQQAPLPLLLH